MYKPHTGKNNSWRQRCGRVVAGTGQLACFSRRPRNVARAESVVRQRRSWQMKKLSRGIQLVILLTILLAGSGWLAISGLSRSDIFQVSSFAVEGNILLTREQVLKMVQLKPGVNLLRIDARQIEGVIDSHPWIESAVVRKIWPSGIEISIRERRPLALINLERDGQKKLYYLDKGGAVFEPLTTVRDLDYPVLTGDIGDDINDQRIKDGSPAAAALEFLLLTARGNQILPVQALSQVHVDREGGLIVYLIDHPFPIYMGRDKIRTRFDNLVKLLAGLYRQDKIKDIHEIRMDYAEDKILVAAEGA